jgi:hypothetical protein
LLHAGHTRTKVCAHPPSGIIAVFIKVSDQTASSFELTNQQQRQVEVSRLISPFGRIENACRSIARSNCSGGIEGRPKGE